MDQRGLKNLTHGTMRRSDKEGHNSIHLALV